MDERIRGRRREVARSQGRRRLLVAAVLVLVAAAVGGYFWLRSSEVFAVRRVSLPVTERIGSAQLQAAVQSVAGVNLLVVSPVEIERRLRAIPYVRSARVYRRFPHTLEVRLTEYEPAAVVQADDGGSWVVAREGRVLESVDEAPAGLLRIVPQGQGPLEEGGMVETRVASALALLDVLAKGTVWPPAYGVSRLEVSEVGELVLVLDDGTEVRLGEPTELEQKLMVASRIIERYLSEGKELEYVDVQVPSPGVAKEK